MGQRDQHTLYIRWQDQATVQVAQNVLRGPDNNQGEHNLFRSTDAYIFGMRNRRWCLDTKQASILGDTILTF